jgi:hypothetical protein
MKRPMTKTQFLGHVQALYRVGNNSDSEFKVAWTKPDMAGPACCRHLDRLLRDMVECGALSEDDVAEFSNTL